MRRRPSKPRPTMTDIARLVGVSQSCVSLILNDAPGSRISEATRQEVRAAAERLNYRLPGRREIARIATPNVIAYVVDEISVSPHPVLHVDGLRDSAWAYECTVQIHVTRANQALEAASLAAICRDKAVAGLVYAMSFTREVELPPGLPKIPIVLLNCYTREKTHPTLLPGEVAGGFAATQHLLEHGHRRVAMIGGEPWMDAARDRLKGYRQALATADLGFDRTMVRDGDWSADGGYQHTRDLMASPHPPTAIFCASDTMALGCMDALAELGLKIPDDVSVIGYNDLELTRHTRPPLSTCRVPNYDMGWRAAENLLDTVQNGTQPRPVLARLECQIVPRASVASPKSVARYNLKARRRRPVDGAESFAAS